MIGMFEIMLTIEYQINLAHLLGSSTLIFGVCRTALELGALPSSYSFVVASQTLSEDVILLLLLFLWPQVGHAICFPITFPNQMGCWSCSNLKGM